MMGVCSRKQSVWYIQLTLPNHATTQCTIFEPGYKQLRIPNECIIVITVANIEFGLAQKKAILVTVSKLPIATAKAYTDANIKKAFMINGQLDLAHKLVPSLFNLLNIYRGDIDTTPLRNRKELIETLYEEVHTTGMLSEKQ